MTERLTKQLDKKIHNPQKVIFFDLEISKQFQRGQDPFLLSPLGVIVAVTQEYWDEPVVWNEEDFSVCSKNTLRALLGYLSARIKEGYKIVTWNGLSFDFRVLAEETDEYEKCIEIANSIHHIDMMYHFFCMTGFPVSLANIAEGMELGSKESGIDGAMIPSLWKQKKYDLVIDYAKRDVRLTAGIYTEININDKSKIYWLTNSGGLQNRTMVDKWGSVVTNNQIALPKRAIWDRSKFLGWMNYSYGGKNNYIERRNT